MAAAVAVLAVAASAGCSGQAPASGSAGGAGSPAASSPAAGGAAPSSAAAPVPLSWSAARAPLPTDASGVSGQYAQLVDVSCPDASYCVAVGSDRASTSGGDAYQGLVDTLSDGTWTATALPDVSSKKGFAELAGVSCPAHGNCVIAGFYFPTASTQVPVIETLAGGRWVPVKPPLPADAAATATAILNDVTCPVAGTCLATGWYDTQGGFRDAYVDMLANGAWTATTLPLPSDAAQQTSSSSSGTYAAAGACPRAGSCVVTGQYQDGNGQTQAFIDTLSGGAWTSARAALPADAATTGQIASLWAISCPAPGACIAGGHYIGSGGQPGYLTETQSGGAWTAAAAPLPADAAADQRWTQYGGTSIGGLSCESAGACVATAGYVGHASEFLPTIETLSSGTWTATPAPLPADAAPGAGQSSASYLAFLDCSAAGHCLTVGSYPAADGTTEPMIVRAEPR